MADEKMDKKRPVQGESELKKMQQSLVDDTVDDSFPASDPPAWTTTGSKSVAARTDASSRGSTGQTQDRGGSRSSGSRAAGLADQATHLAENAVRTGSHYLDEIRHRLPEAERYYERGRRAVARPVSAYPLAALLLAATAGYGLAWFLHGRASSGGSSGRNRPAYGRRPGGAGRAADRYSDERFSPGVGMAAARRQAMAASSAPSSY